MSHFFFGLAKLCAEHVGWFSSVSSQHSTDHPKQKLCKNRFDFITLCLPPSRIEILGNKPKIFLLLSDFIFLQMFIDGVPAKEEK